MVSWIEELERRERVVLERLEVLRQQIAALTEQVAEQEEQLSRLAITRETMTQILTGADQPEAPGRVSGAVVGSPIGVVTVPPWRPGLDAGVLPVAYRDILEVLADAGRPLRAKPIAVALGLPTDAAKVEGLRSKLKRLTERGWLSEPSPGLFAAAGMDAAAGLAATDRPPRPGPGGGPVDGPGLVDQPVERGVLPP